MEHHSILIDLYVDRKVIEGTVLLVRNQGSTLFTEDTPNAIITYNFWREHRLIVVDPDRPRHFRLNMINREQLLALNNT